MERNPVAFLEDAAAQAESEDRIATDIAFQRLEHLRQSPFDPKTLRDFMDAILQLRRERPYFIPPSFHKEARTNTIHRFLIGS